MSSALAIASVTAVLKSLLDNRLIQQGVAASVGDVTVTALPPDRIATGADERSQLNLFLYRITPNTGWRGPRLGNGHSAPGGRAAALAADGAPAPLALDLHYLLTAYGEQDFHGEILLGYAMQLLHEHATLTRERIRGVLNAPSATGGVVPPARAALAASTLADQVESMTISPEFSDTEEMSRLWSALQARYRPSAAYKVSAVLIGADHGPAGGQRGGQRTEAPAEPAGDDAKAPARGAARGTRR